MGTFFSSYMGCVYKTLDIYGAAYMNEMVIQEGNILYAFDVEKVLNFILKITKSNILS